MHGIIIFQEHLHSNKRFPALLREHVPGLGPGQEVGHGPLGQAENGLAEQPLTD